MKKKSKIVLNMERMDELACSRKKELKRRPTLAEEKFKEILRKYKIPFSFQKIVYTPNMFYIIDFRIAMKPRKIIEIDGSSHDNPIKDKIREDCILKTRTYKKYKFVRITNEEVFNGKAVDILELIYPRKFRLWKLQNS